MNRAAIADAPGLLDARYLAFLETVTHLRPKLHRYCSRMTGSVLDGEDVVQDALFQAYRKLDSFERRHRACARNVAMAPIAEVISMIDGMGIFRTTIAIAHLSRPAVRRELAEVMVDTGSEYNWIPRDVLESLGIQPQRTERFESADGRILEREVGFALLFAAGRSAPTIAVFADAGDMTLLGAFGLEGLNMRIDLARKELVPAGPVPAAVAA